MPCKICQEQVKPAFQTTILERYSVTFFQCEACGFVQSEKPFWIEEAYKNSMNLSDTGIVVRNSRAARIATSIIFLFFNKRGKFLDYAGGFGLFTRMMRDTGIDFFWNDPFTKNELARGFEMPIGERYELATTFESFEHFEDPLLETQKILGVTDNILASTEIIPQPLPNIKDWWYYGFDHGQHIAFYTKKSFQQLAKRFSLHYYGIDNFHLLTKRKLPFWGGLLLGFKYAKHLLYLVSFPIELFLVSKTHADLVKLKTKSANIKPSGQ